jgi:hypothetical protein
MLLERTGDSEDLLVTEQAKLGPDAEGAELGQPAH